ncbi:MAG: tetratricopeptide repeat protein [Micromonosporaceae bacterium]|nr:tetratricopeptide repeat protein [Micromonosporaceae bacterium]
MTRVASGVWTVVEFRLLGPVEVWAGGQRFEISEPRRKGVLAALLVDAGLVVPATTLVRRVWGDAAPDKAHNTLRTHVTRIRRVLEQATGGSLPIAVLSEPGGYRLAVDRVQVDLHQFRSLVQQAGNPGSALGQGIDFLREARALWRGVPLTGIPGDWAHRTREHLVQELLHATAAWAQAEVRGGNPAAVLAPLIPLAEEYPLMEPLTAVLLRALVAAGRPTEALTRGRRHRQVLAEDYGTDQGPELRALYQAILREDLDLGLKSDPGPAQRSMEVPAQLPAEVAAFAGRAGYLTRLDALMNPPTGQQPERRATTLVAISGTAGIGKTSLALHWAHHNAARFPDGQLYVNLGGYTSPGQITHPTEAMRQFLDALGVPPQRIPTDPAALAALYRTVMAGRSMLLLLDNARDTAQVRPLLPGTPNCRVIVTSRNQLTGLIATDGAVPITLDLLTCEEGRELLRLRLGDHRIEAEPAAADEMVDRCARLPLALAIAAAHAAISPGTPLRDLARILGDPDQRWQMLTGDDSASHLRTVFSWSYQALTPAAAGLFRLLGLHPGPDITAPAAASLAGVPLAEATLTLSELVRASLLSEQRPCRFALHDLLRSYAADLACGEESESVRRAALRRLFDHHLHTAAVANQVQYPHRMPNPRPPQPPVEGADPLVPEDSAAALAWLAGECPVLLSLLHAAPAGFDNHAYQLAWILTTFLSRQFRWRELVAAWNAALPAADRLGDLRAQATARRLLAYAETPLGEHTAAWQHNEEALERYEQAGDRRGQAEILHNMAFVCQGRNQPARALEYGHRALALACGVPEGRASEASIRNGIACCLHQLGDFAAAVVEAQQAALLFRQTGDGYGEAASHHTLGRAYHDLGDFARASASFQQSVELCQQLEEPYHEAMALDCLGDSCRAIGDQPGARRAWQRSLDILVGLNHAEAVAVRAKLAR